MSILACHNEHLCNYCKKGKRWCHCTHGCYGNSSMSNIRNKYLKEKTGTMPVSSFKRKDGFLLERQYLYSWTLLFLALLSDSSTYTSRIAYADIYHSMKYCKFSRAVKQSILEFTSRVNDRRYLTSVCKHIPREQNYSSSTYILVPSV